MIKTILLASLIVMALGLISSQVVNGSQSNEQSMINEAKDTLSKMKEVKQCYSLPKEDLKQCVIDAMGWSQLEVVQAINDGTLQAYMTDQGGLVTNTIKAFEKSISSVTNVTPQQQEELNKLCGGKCK
jgi:hypothetical protein